MLRQGGRLGAAGRAAPRFASVRAAARLHPSLPSPPPASAREEAAAAARPLQHPAAAAPPRPQRRRHPWPTGASSGGPSVRGRRWTAGLGQARVIARRGGEPGPPLPAPALRERRAMAGGAAGPSFPLGRGQRSPQAPPLGTASPRGASRRGPRGVSKWPPRGCLSGPAGRPRRTASAARQEPARQGRRERRREAEFVA